MKRRIVTPALLAPEALAELKLWLGITTTQDDAPLGDLLRSALELCEGFTGTMPLTAECEEMLPLASTWQALATRPVQAITEVLAVDADGSATALAADAFAVELDAEGGGRVLVTAPGDAARLAVRFTSGLADSWAELPDSLRQGVMRLAAHQHRERESSGAAPVPPAAVASLWRPWRRMRLA